MLNAENQLAAQQASDAAGRTPAEDTEQGTEKSGAIDPSNPQNLTAEEKRKVEKLKQRDREVRAHEQAHKAVGGSLASSPRYETVRGPDGKSYAISGEVQIDTSTVPNNPEATIRKMEQVKRAALAPANPSAQDRRVAAEAEAKIQAARQEKREQEAEELEKANAKKDGDPADPAAGGASSGARPGSFLDLVA